MNNNRQFQQALDDNILQEPRSQLHRLTGLSRTLHHRYGTLDRPRRIRVAPRNRATKKSSERLFYLEGCQFVRIGHRETASSAHWHSLKRPALWGAGS